MDELVKEFKFFLFFKIDIFLDSINEVIEKFIFYWVDYDKFEENLWLLLELFFVGYILFEVI